jgi:hypothetical protein
MKISLIFLLSLLIISSFNLKAQVNQEWVARYNGTGNGIDQAYSMAVDGSGNVYVTGKSMGAGTGYDYATVKYNSSGIQQWVARYNGPEDSTDIPVGIAIDISGNVYVAGNSRGISSGNDYAIVKYNSSGVQLWAARTSFNGDEIASSFSVDTGGNVYVTGTYGLGYMTVKYNTDGIQQWINNYYFVNRPSMGIALALDDSSNVYVTGQSFNGCCSSSYATVKYNSSGVQQWVQRHSSGGGNWGEGTSIVIDNTGNSYITGWSGGIITTVKYNISGSQLWDVGYAGSTSNHRYSVVFDGLHNVYVAGVSWTTPSIIKYDANGVQQWVQNYSGSDANSLKTDAAGNVYVAGNSGADYIIMKFNSSGIQQWVQSYNGPGNGDDAATSMAIDASGNVFVSGYSIGNGTDYDYATIKYSQLLGINPISSEIPKQFNLCQNYPNPFNPATKIKFSLPNPSEGGAINTKLTVYDILGREAATLVNEQLKPGSYEVEWNAGNNPSGVYFYRLISQDFTQTKKLVLIK